jgi:dephospho-CoA kinase
MIKLGLTGGIGSGKSTVAEIFKALFVPVYSADKEAKRLMTCDELLKQQIITLMGSEAYFRGNLNAQFISKQVFFDPEKLRKLNAVVHPAVHLDFGKWLHEHGDSKYIIQEAAIIFESGIENMFDKIIVVDAPEDIRIKRVMERDNIEEQQVRARMKNQLPGNEIITRGDFIIRNYGKHLLLPQVLELHNKFVSLQSD